MEQKQTDMLEKITESRDAYEQLESLKSQADEEN